MAQTKEFVKTLNMAAIDHDACKRAAALPDGSTDVIEIGTVIGKVRGYSFRANTQNPEAGPSVAFTGYFEGVPADPAKPTIVASAVFLPSAIQEALSSQMIDPTKPRPSGVIARGKSQDVSLEGEIPIAVEVGARKGKVAGGAGYQFSTRLLTETMQKSDPLGDMRQLVGGRGATGGAPALAAPAKPPAKKGGKK